MQYVQPNAAQTFSCLHCPGPSHSKSIHEQVLPSFGLGALEEEEVGTASLSQQQAGGGSKVPTLALSSSWTLMGR